MAEGPTTDPRPPLRQQPLPLAAWLLGVAAIAAWVCVRIDRTGMTAIDRSQGFFQAQAIAHLHLGHLMAGDPTSPPGYSLFSLPILLLLRHSRGHGDVLQTEWWAWAQACWPAFAVLGVTVVALLRTTGIARRSTDELVRLGCVVGAGSTVATVTESYHPNDLLALAGVLLAVVALARRRIGWAVVALGTALLMKQWAIVGIGVLACLHRGRDRALLLLGPLVIAAVVIVPTVLQNRSRALESITAATNRATRRTLMGHLYHSSRLVIALQGRVLPIAVLLALCLWLLHREAGFDVRTALAALAVGFVARALVDPAGFLYYALPGVTCLMVVGRRTGRAVAMLVASLALARWNGAGITFFAPYDHVSLLVAALTTGLLAVYQVLAILDLRGAVNRSAPAGPV